MEKIKSMSKKRKNIIILIIVLVLIGASAISIYSYKMKNSNVTKNEEQSDIVEIPIIKLVPSKNIGVNEKEEFEVDVVLSSLPADIYPAASVSIGFNKDKLEFAGVKKGEMQTYGDISSSGENFVVPLWDCDIKTSNDSGKINAIYLDKTAGKFAYNKFGFDKESKNVVLRLKFKLKNNAKQGEKYALDIKDAIFATVNGDKDNTSLSSIKGTLKVSGCEIVVQN